MYRVILQGLQINISNDSKPICFAMKFSTFCVGLGLLFVAVFLTCFAVHSTSAMNGKLDGLRREDEVDVKRPWAIREKRAVKNNGTPNLPDILKRLEAVEKK